jgi:hypothetical protein
VKYEISKNIFAIETHFFSVSIASNMTQEFNETQKRELMTMMQKFWAQRSAASASQQAQSSTMKLRSNRWVVADLRFFDSTYDEKFLATTESMQHAKKNIFFRDIHLFIKRVRNFAMIKNYDTVKNNLYTCLRDMTMTW